MIDLRVRPHMHHRGPDSVVDGEKNTVCGKVTARMLSLREPLPMNIHVYALRRKTDPLT